MTRVGGAGRVLLLVALVASCGRDPHPVERTDPATTSAAGASTSAPAEAPATTSLAPATTAPSLTGTTRPAAGPTTSSTVAPAAAAVVPLLTANAPCAAPRSADDELDRAEQFLRAAARHENIDDRIAQVEYLGPEGTTQPTTKFRERIHAALASFGSMPPELTLDGVPEMERRCYPGYPAGCDFVGDFHTQCMALLRRPGLPSITLMISHAGNGFELVTTVRTGGALAAARAARGLDVAELFTSDTLAEDGTRSPRPTSSRQPADALRDDLRGASFLGERCAPSSRHLDCLVTMRRDTGDLEVRFLVAPVADGGWAIESYELG